MRFIKEIVVISIVIFGSGTIWSQDFLTAEDLNGRSQKAYESAQEYFRSQQFASVENELTSLIEKYPNFIDGLLLRAALYAETNQFEQAETDYEAALLLSDSYYKFLTYHLAKAELTQEKYGEGIEHLEQFLRRPDLRPNRKAEVERLLGEAKIAHSFYANPVPYEPRSIGPNINTEGREYLPSFNAKGDLLIYTVNRQRQEDFFVSHLSDEGEWGMGKPLEGVNTPQNEGAQSMAADGKTLVFTACHRRGGEGSCDLYLATFKNGQWTTPGNMGPTINGPGWESQPALSADGKQLFFTSNRKGGHGGDDIWRSFRNADGTWTEPVNAGGVINSSGDDGAPFLHADGQTLYFMSTGHPGLGKTDLFVSRIDENGAWQTPKNLGYPINTAEEEGAMVVSLDGKTAYFTTGKNSVEGAPTNLDIYYFDLYEAARPQQVTYVEGKVIDARTKQPLAGAEITINTPGYTHQLITDRDGAFLLVLPIGQDYAFYANKKDYVFFSERFELPDSLANTAPFQLKIPLMPLEESLVTEASAKPVVLRNVLFETGSADLIAASYSELDRLADLLMNHQNLNIQINGHTDDVGDGNANQALSENRAKSVYEFLIEKGIPSERLQYKGFGESMPLVPNESAANRALNRRTEFEILSAS